MRSIPIVLSSLLLTAAVHSLLACVMIHETDQILTDRCDGSGGPLADGTIVSIYWDNDGSGPDDNDPIAPVGQGIGEWNFNQFAVNGCADLGQCGLFFPDACWTANGNIPPTPRYFLRIWTIADSCGRVARWTSGVYVATPGFEEQWEASEWVCAELGPDCPRNLVLYPSGDSDICLRWSGVSSVTGYNVYRGLTSDVPFGQSTLIAFTVDTSYTDTDILDDPGGSYYYAVTAEAP